MKIGLQQYWNLLVDYLKLQKGRVVKFAVSVAMPSGLSPQCYSKAIAQALNREEQAKQAIASHNQLLETTKNQLSPDISGQTIIVLGIN